MAKVLRIFLRPKNLGESDHWVIVGTSSGYKVVRTCVLADLAEGH